MDQKNFELLVKRRDVPVRDRTSSCYVSARKWKVKGLGLAYRAAYERRALLKRWGHLQPGDHLVTPRGVDPLSYTHHGLYLGKGMVIHYAGWHRMFESGPICLTWLDDFAADRNIDVQNHADHDKINRQYAIRRAVKRLGERKYSLLTRNCEHFVEKCITQKSRSYQVERKLKQTGHLLGGSAVGSIIVRKGIKLLAFRLLPKTGVPILMAVGSFL